MKKKVIYFLILYVFYHVKKGASVTYPQNLNLNIV